MDLLIIVCTCLVMLLFGYIQYHIALCMRKYMFLLPLIFAILVFWLGFVSLLFAFVLIFIGELTPSNPQKETRSTHAEEPDQ